MGETVTATETKPVVAPTDQDNPIAHVAPKSRIAEGYILGVPVRALCGIEFVPFRNPDGLPVCEVCMAELERIKFRDRGQRGLN